MAALMGVPGGYTLSAQSNADVIGMWVALELACGKKKAALISHHRKYLCTLAVIVDAELERRGLGRPTWPLKA